VGSLGASFSVRPPPPVEMALPPLPKPCAPALPADDYVTPALALHGMPQRPPLRVSLQIFSADPAPAPASAPASASVSASAPAGPDRHHVDIRRQQGEHWHFQPFYAAFRLEFSKRLGMADYTQLSMHSPVQKKRPQP